ncbi:MAG: hypothetical protein AAGE52_38030 [Myxococcota bacterium]
MLSFLVRRRSRPTHTLDVLVGVLSALVFFLVPLILERVILEREAMQNADALLTPMAALVLRFVGVFAFAGISAWRVLRLRRHGAFYQQPGLVPKRLISLALVAIFVLCPIVLKGDNAQELLGLSYRVCFRINIAGLAIWPIGLWLGGAIVDARLRRRARVWPIGS